MRYLLIISLFLASCNPCERLWRRCPPIIVDSIRVDSIVRLDTITFISQGDTVRIGEETLKGFGIIIDTEKQKVIRKKGYTEFICKEDSLQSVISILEYHLENSRTFVKEVVKSVYVYRNSKYHTLTGILSPILFLFLIGAVVLIFKK